MIDKSVTARTGRRGPETDLDWIHQRNAGGSVRYECQDLSRWYRRNERRHRRGIDPREIPRLTAWLTYWLTGEVSFRLLWREIPATHAVIPSGDIARHACKTRKGKAKRVIVLCVTYSRYLMCVWFLYKSDLWICMKSRAIPAFAESLIRDRAESIPETLLIRIEVETCPCAFLFGRKSFLFAFELTQVTLTGPKLLRFIDVLVRALSARHDVSKFVTRRNDARRQTVFSRQKRAR